MDIDLVAQSSRTRRRTARDRQHSVSRELVLRTLERSGPASVADLARDTRLHENTVRGHLARLETDGHVRRAEPAPSGERGRPTVRWSALPPESLGPYAGLADTLADALEHAGGAAPTLAFEAGVRWAGRIAETRPADPRALLVRTMREHGFAPQDGPAPKGDGAGDGGSSAGSQNDHADIVLTSCPLLAAATQRSRIVCAAHAGMVAGLANAELVPFATPTTCAIHLRRAS